MILRARLVLPLSRPPLPDGAVVVERDRVAWVGPWKDLPPQAKGPLVDLGHCLLMPGLVNAHAHLDYTGMAGLIPPRRSFADWIKSINALKGSTTLDEYKKAWQLGATMLAESGTTTVANISAIPELLPGTLSGAPLRVISLIEVIGIKPERDPASVLAPALACLESCRQLGYPTGLSPHSPYATTPALMRLCLRTPADWPLSIHLAESEEEFSMFRSARGPLYDWLRPQRDMSDCGQGTPAAWLDTLGVPERQLLAVHANYLEPGDVKLLARWGACVAHCPHSHAYFRHRPFPLETLVSAGITVCLGTDSLASRENEGGAKPVLDMRSEMRLLAQAHPGLAPGQIVRMATLHGALALNRPGQMGEITPGALADLVAFDCSGPEELICEEMIHSKMPVLASLKEGKWMIPPGYLSHPD